MNVSCIEERSLKFGGFATETAMEIGAGNPLSLKTGTKPRRNCGNGWMPEIRTF
jgi:hypothetical protein